MLAILGWILFGLLVGIIAKMIMPGPDPGGTIVTIIIGIVGALVGGFIGQALLGYGRIDSMNNVNEPGFLTSLVLSVLGSVILLAVYRLIRGRSLRA